jgi:GDP-L-fucose synthase
MEILVTGATGFLGTALCTKLEGCGHRIVRLSSKNCDLTKQGSLDQFNDRAYDQIYHLAAWTQAGDFCLSHAGEQWVINQQINTNVLTWWHARQPQAKLIAMGTSCAYSPDLPLSEEYYLSGLPIDSLFTYAMSKRMLYVGLLALAKQYGMKYLCLVPSTLYGPGYHLDGRQMHFIFDLMRKILSAKLYNTPVVLWGDGHQRRELVLLSDFVEQAAHLAVNVDNDLVNLGAGKDYSIRDFARFICEIVDFDFERIQFDVSRYVGAKSKCLVTQKLRRLMPNHRPTPLRLGLRKTIDWLRAHQDQLLAAPTPLRASGPS